MLFKNKTLKPCLLNNYCGAFLIIFFMFFCGTTILANTNTKLVNNFIKENKEVLEPAAINKNYLRKTKTVKTHDAEVLQVVNKVLQAEAYSKNFDNINNHSISLYLEALSKAEKISDENLLVYVNTQVGFFYYSYNEYIKAMPFFIKSSNLLNENNIDDLIQPADVYKKNAYFFWKHQSASKKYQLSSKSFKIYTFKL